MSILADWQIAARCEGGMVTPFDPELVNPASLDVRLGDTLLIESAVDDAMVPCPLGGHTEQNPYLLVPGQFVLAHTMVFHQMAATPQRSYAVVGRYNGDSTVQASRG